MCQLPLLLFQVMIPIKRNREVLNTVTEFVSSTLHMRNNKNPITSAHVLISVTGTSYGASVITLLMERRSATDTC